MKMNILHTEASPGWGGQEIRILREAIAMRERGHNLVFAIQADGGLVKPLREKGFKVYEIPFTYKRSIRCLLTLFKIFKKHKIDIINSHSSIDSWLTGIAARLKCIKIVRTRHLSTPIRKGLNSRLLYKTLADAVVTTCKRAALTIREQASISPERCLSIPTGMDIESFKASAADSVAFRKKFKISEDTILIGTTCILRGWKGVQHMMEAIKKLPDMKNLKLVVVGDGVSRLWLENICRELGVTDRVIFTGYIDNPAAAINAMEIFLLLSTANEGVSQASLQAAYLGKPQITTPIGGLDEVCLDGKTGYVVPVADSSAVARAIRKLLKNPQRRKDFGEAARQLVIENYTIKHTYEEMERIYRQVLSSK